MTSAEPAPAATATGVTAGREQGDARFAGRVAVVTGGAKGIGAGCSRVFSAAGGAVVVADRDVAAAGALARELNERGPGRCVVVATDVTIPADLLHMVDEAVRLFGRLDCLVNNAGWHPPSRDISEVEIEDFEALVRLNLTSTFAACKYALPHLARTGGAIVNIASMVGLLGQADAVAYCATKAGQIGLTKALAIDAAKLGVRVNAVCPSAVDTPLMQEWAASLADPAAGLRRLADMHKLGRVARPEEIGRVCLFLATDDSSFITGQAIRVEGGASLDY